MNLGRAVNRNTTNDIRFGSLDDMEVAHFVMLIGNHSVRSTSYYIDRSGN
jgi:hypothetical protein